MTNSKELSRLLKEITILYVEDDDDTRENVADTLSKFTNNLILASDGLEALEMCKTNDIQLIITDIEMPNMDGIEFITEFRDDDMTTPVVMLTAHDTSDYILPCANLNIQSYIIKPITYTKLKETLLKVINYLNVTSNIHIHITNNLSYDKINGVLIVSNNEEISLNKKEKALMDLFVEHKNNLVTYSEIEHTVWYDYDEVMTESALRTVIKNIRKKANVKFINNVSGLGYKLVVK